MHLRENKGYSKGRESPSISLSMQVQKHGSAHLRRHKAICTPAPCAWPAAHMYVELTHRSQGIHVLGLAVSNKIKHSMTHYPLHWSLPMRNEKIYPQRHMRMFTVALLSPKSLWQKAVPMSKKITNVSMQQIPSNNKNYQHMQGE